MCKFINKPEYYKSFWSKYKDGRRNVYNQIWNVSEDFILIFGGIFLLYAGVIHAFVCNKTLPYVNTILIK